MIEKKILVIFGTRPEAIKMAPLVKELKDHTEFNVKVCVTAQHRQMLDQVLKTFRIIPDFDLDIMKENQSLSEITSKVLLGIDNILKDEKPDLVLVHGDTTTSFAGSLAAFYNHIPVGHIEAGLRTWNKYSPFPEEINRQLTSIIAEFHFAPTETSKQNLILEGKNQSDIFITGNTAIDALKTTVIVDYENSLFDWLGNDRLILLTAHRRENLGEKMESMFRGIKKIVDQHTDVKVIYPVHLNPKVQKIARDIFGNDDKFKLIDPLDVIDFHNIMNRAYIILTDSGGIQEEAPSLGKPVLVLRDTTERPEGIQAGTLKLVGTNEDKISFEINELLNDFDKYTSMSRASNPYGDGYASKKIVEILKDKLK